MAKGFIFNHNLCVGCKACLAGCMIENEWTFNPRMILTINPDVIHNLPLVNLSLACNHCEKAVCMDGCPTGSYHRDILTGAVLIDDKKCIGCKYCQWNCPWDAPKYDHVKHVIGKCSLCYSELTGEALPACATACPTGALGYGELSQPAVEKLFPWLPDKILGPSLELSGTRNHKPLRIVPSDAFEAVMPREADKNTISRGDWSLVLFSFLTTVSVATLISSALKGVFPNSFIFTLILVFSGIVSLFHLGKQFRAWRALRNIKTSPLSREIAFFLFYSMFSVLSVFIQGPALIIASSFTGLILLILVDSVYIYSDRRMSVLTHSGQTFLSGLTIASFLAGTVLPFLFIAVVRLLSSVHRLYLGNRNDNIFLIRYFRLALLVIAGASLVTGISYQHTAILFLFLLGEFLDRVIFYSDFKPQNISRLTDQQKTMYRNEKERG